MISFHITAINGDIRADIQDKIDNLTKPKGSLGMLEELALQIGLIQQSLSPSLQNPHHIVFAADHGIVEEGVSPSPKEVTYQMVANFLQGGAGINFLARQHQFDLSIVDTGVDHEFSEEEKKRIVNMKIRGGTRNYLHQAAMTQEEGERCLQNGAICTQSCYDKGCNVIGFGEMGITNTSSSALWVSYLMGKDLKECVGAGCDDTGSIIAHKYQVLKRATENYKGDGSPEDIMYYFGGYELVTAVGAMLKAAELGMIILVDGIIMTACAMMASKLKPHFLPYCIFGHEGAELVHGEALRYLGAKPLLQMGFRLGEGTGALCAYPIVESAVRMINEMNSFKTITVEKYFS